MSKKTENTAHSDKELYTVEEWVKAFDYPPTGTLRHLISHSENNGFDKVVRRVGRRILLCRKSFIQWVEEKQDR